MARDVNLAGAIQLIREHDVVAPRALQRSVPRDLDTICWKCLQKDPAQRYPQALDLADDLKRYLDGEPIQARGLNWFETLHAVGSPTTWPGRDVDRDCAVLRLAPAASVSSYRVKHGLSHSIFGPPFLPSCGPTGAWGFQRALLKYGGRSRILFAWATMDVLLLTLFLIVGGMHGAASGLVYLYFPIVAVSSLRFRPDLVAYVTLLSLSGYSVSCLAK